MKKLKIEMVHDVVCSWCPIGYRNIQKALRHMNVEADFHFLPYELNPDMRAEGEAIDAYFERRNQWDNASLLDYQKNLLAVAESADVAIDFSRRTHYYNSGKAHQLMHWAEGYNQQQPLNELLIDAYLKRGLDISNTLILLELVEQLGLDSSQAVQILNSSVINPQLLRKKQRVQQLTLSRIPAFIINEDTLIFGSNSVDYFEQALASLLDNDSGSLDIETKPS
jgi:predicted DsbA family dithiol-disulfide isomerase